jgi:hypothetical protein
MVNKPKSVHEISHDGEWEYSAAMGWQFIVRGDPDPKENLLRMLDPNNTAACQRLRDLLRRRGR